MDIVKGLQGRKSTWQADFPETTKCCRCSETARFAFTAMEEREESKTYICDMYPNVAGARWPHDAVAVAVYFCTECLETTALYNQA